MFGVMLRQAQHDVWLSMTVVDGLQALYAPARVRRLAAVDGLPRTYGPRRGRVGGGCGVMLRQAQHDVGLAVRSGSP
ncbi:MAG: hypothetical protein AMXMBFR61_22530 [Fimbriimonadales bacterium]